jgi:hypothetical protein
MDEAFESSVLYDTIEIAVAVPINRRLNISFEQYCKNLAEINSGYARIFCLNPFRSVQSAKIRVGEVSFKITYEPFPMDSELLASSAKLTSWWPNSMSLIGCHEATIRISTMSKPDTRLTDILELTALTRDAIESTDCEAVYWGDGIINSKEDFLQLSKSVKSTTFVSMLWVNIKAHELDDGSFRLYTYGLEYFKLPDLEIDYFRADVPGAVIAIICLLVDSLILGRTELIILDESPPPLSFGETVYGVLGNSFMNPAEIVCKLRWSSDKTRTRE